MAASSLRPLLTVLLIYLRISPTQPAGKAAATVSRSSGGPNAGHYWKEYPQYFTGVYGMQTPVPQDVVSEEEDEEDTKTPPPDPQPLFLDGPTDTITAQLGTKVVLKCNVSDLGDKTISWVRRRGDDFVILSAGRLTLASDGRWVLQASPPSDWKMVLHPVAARDQGVYECQISTHPPMVRRIELTVHVPKVEIVDERGVSVSDKFYKEGSIIELRCVISKVPQLNGLVLWTHQGRQLNFDTKRGGISVKTEVNDDGALSRLYIANAAKQDSGNYTCALEDVTTTTVAVHVLRGENPLAMQRGRSTSTHPLSVVFILLSSICLVFR